MMYVLVELKRASCKTVISSFIFELERSGLNLGNFELQWNLSSKFGKLWGEIKLTSCRKNRPIIRGGMGKSK